MIRILAVLLLVVALAGCQSAKNINVCVGGCDIRKGGESVSMEGGGQTPNVTIGINNKNVPVSTTVTPTSLGF